MLPTLDEISHIFADENDCIRFLINKEILYQSPTCVVHRRRMIRNHTVWRCKKCDESGRGRNVSVFKDTIFFNCRIGVGKALRIGYFWLAKMPSSVIQTLTGHGSETIARYLREYRMLVSQDIRNEDQKIGGEGIIVEIDETLIRSVKNSRQGDQQVWVFGGVERTAERHIFAKVVVNRTRETLFEVLAHHVLPGSIIMSDCWSSYDAIQETFGLTHLSVNHSQYFRDPVTGAHTNTIEGMWRGLKLAIPSRERNLGRVENHISEFIWRRQNYGNLWQAFLNCLRNTALF